MHYGNYYYNYQKKNVQLFAIYFVVVNIEFSYTFTIYLWSIKYFAGMLQTYIRFSRKWLPVCGCF